MGWDVSLFVELGLSVQRGEVGGGEGGEGTMKVEDDEEAGDYIMRLESMTGYSSG